MESVQCDKTLDGWANPVWLYCFWRKLKQVWEMMWTCMSGNITFGEFQTKLVISVCKWQIKFGNWQFDYPDSEISAVTLTGYSIGCMSLCVCVCSTRMMIRDALNKQTAMQFRQYAEQQFPNDTAQVQLVNSHCFKLTFRVTFVPILLSVSWFRRKYPYFWKYLNCLVTHSRLEQRSLRAKS